ncbi:MAG: SDR family oxidoreductase [Bacilli bacterium]
MKKVLVLGGNGMAGNMIKTYFLEKGYEVFSTQTKDTNETNCYKYNIMENMKSLEKIVEEIRPDLVINAVGILNQAAEDNKVLAVTVNSLFPHYVDSISKEYGFKFIHMSTDCVYSGSKGQYNESDLPDATSFYGRSKALGEINNDSNLTIRTSIIGPDVNENGIGLFNWFMKQTGEINGYANVIWSGVTTLELAKAMLAAYEQDLKGLYILVNNDVINKYDLALLFKKYMEKDIKINKYLEKIENKSMHSTRNDFDYKVPSYDKMICEMSTFIKEHKSKYKY